MERVRERERERDSARKARQKGVEAVGDDGGSVIGCGCCVVGDSGDLEGSSDFEEF
jgi:hypothetical protein